MFKADQIKDLLAMRDIKVFRVHNVVPDDMRIYPGKIIHVDRVDALQYSMGVDPAWVPMSKGEMKFRRALRQIDEE